MKKQIIVAAVIILGAIGLQAQQGTVLLGGNVSYSHLKDEAATPEFKRSIFGINPFIGYQFSEKMTIGVEGSYGSATARNIAANGSETKTDGQQWELGGFLRYTQPLSDLFSVFGQLGAGYVSGEYLVNETTNTVGTNDDNGFYVYAKPALFINFKNSFGLNFDIGGIQYESIGDQKDFLITFGKSVNAGISKNFKL